MTDAAKWRLFEGSDADWDRLVESFPDGNPFQSAAWAAHKSEFGWTPIRLQADRSAAVQFLAKSKLGLKLLWSRGGPLGDPAAWADGLAQAAAQAAGTPLAYLRVSPYRSADPEPLSRAGWRPPSRPLAGSASFELDLSRSEQDLLAGLSGNWSHNLRRGLKRASFRVWENPDVAELSALYRGLEAYKGLREQHGRDELSSLLRHLGRRVLLLRADGPDGRAVALRACALWGESAWDLLAAANADARKNYASYVLLWELVRASRARGATRYDLGGADAEAAKGVYDFKKGTGARPVEYLGEREWASWPGLARAVNWALASKGLGA